MEENTVKLKPMPNTLKSIRTSSKKRQKTRPVRTTGKRKPKSISTLKKELQILVNKFCKLRDCKDGGGICISCQKWYSEERLNGGHFIPSTYSAVRFNEDNIHAQCAWNCNMHRRGNLIEYRLNLIKKIGEARVLELEAHRNDLVKWDRSELMEKIEYYKNKLGMIC